MEIFNDLIQYISRVIRTRWRRVLGHNVRRDDLSYAAGWFSSPEASRIPSFGGLHRVLPRHRPDRRAMIFAVLSALGIEWAGSRGRIREDSAIGIIWSVGMAVGALFMSLRPGYTSGDLRIPVRQHRHRDARRRRGHSALTVLTLFIIAGGCYGCGR